MARAEWRSAAARLPCPDALRFEQRRCGQHAQSLGRVSLHRFGVGGECDRISAVSEGLIRLTLVLAIQSFLRPPSESYHQRSRSSAICAREDNDLQCAFPVGPVPVSKLPRFPPETAAVHMASLRNGPMEGSALSFRRARTAFAPALGAIRITILRNMQPPSCGKGGRRSKQERWRRRTCSSRLARR
jgi:hypothetical protein